MMAGGVCIVGVWGGGGKQTVPREFARLRVFFIFSFKHPCHRVRHDLCRAPAGLGKDSLGPSARNCPAYMPKQRTELGHGEQ